MEATWEGGASKDLELSLQQTDKSTGCSSQPEHWAQFNKNYSISRVHTRKERCCCQQSSLLPLPKSTSSSATMTGTGQIVCVAFDIGGSLECTDLLLGLAMRMRNMRMMRIMRICGICGCVCGLKISSTLYTYEYLPKMATFWARNGSAWLCFQFWVPKISLLFIPPGFIHPQEWKLRVQNHKILVKKRWFFFTIDAVYAHWCASDAHRCASAKIGAWPTLITISNG